MSRKEQPVVLIVEDNPTGIASLVGILGAACELIIAKSVAQAKLCLQPDVDVVLLDLYLPDAPGIELLRHLKSEPSFQHIPVICISASDQTSDIERAFREGAIDYVLKPFNRTILSAKVSTFVEYKRKTSLLETQALQDPLTSIANRRMFEQRLDVEWRRGLRQEFMLGLVLVDLDNFKDINDQHGHAQGDNCLQRLAGAMELTFGRAGELVARIGGDEFAAILPGVSLEQAVQAAQRLKGALTNECKKCKDAGGLCPEFTASIGCFSMVPVSSSSADYLLGQADRHLYDAKGEGGRDCVRPIISS